MPNASDYTDSQITAGITSTDLIVNPATWINRRVETVELLSHEETRRRVSVDFTLTPDILEDLTIGDGFVVPISVLTKEPRRNFDLRDESDAAVPVLGKRANGELAHIAVLNAALGALPEEVTSEALEILSADLGQIVLSEPDSSEDALAFFIGGAESGDPLRSAVWNDATCRTLLEILWENYVLFAVLSQDARNRRVLKYSYGDDFTRPAKGTFKERLAFSFLGDRLWRPDRSYFVVQCPGAARAASFHAEIAVPEALRVESAVLYDLASGEAASDLEEDVNRVSLYASSSITGEADISAIVEIAPERPGRLSQAAGTAVAVAGLLWLGVVSGLNATNPAPAVSLLLAGAAVFSGVAAVRGEHVLAKTLFAPFRRWLGVVAVAALTASATLAMEVPNAHPVCVWWVAAVACSLAAARLLWSAIRAPG
jgi:hypothetical protein